MSRRFCYQDNRETKSWRRACRRAWAVRVHGRPPGAHPGIGGPQGLRPRDRYRRFARPEQIRRLQHGPPSGGAGLCQLRKIPRLHSHAAGPGRRQPHQGAPSNPHRNARTSGLESRPPCRRRWRPSNTISSRRRCTSSPSWCISGAPIPTISKPSSSTAKQSSWRLCLPPLICPEQTSSPDAQKLPSAPQGHVSSTRPCPTDCSSAKWTIFRGARAAANTMAKPALC